MMELFIVPHGVREGKAVDVAQIQNNHRRKILLIGGPCET